MIDKASRTLSRFIGITLFMFGVMLFASCNDGTDPGPEQEVKIHWSQTNGPDGGTILSLAISGNNTLAGSNHGIFSSENNGDNWKILSPAQIVRSMVTRDNNVFAATLEGVTVSTDNGNAWTNPGVLRVTG